MPEKHDLLAAILAAKEQGHRGNLAFAKAYSSRQIYAGAFIKKITQRCAYTFSSSFVTFDFAGLSSTAYITSVFIGYIGTDSIGSLINANPKSRE